MGGGGLFGSGLGTEAQASLAPLEDAAPGIIASAIGIAAEAIPFVGPVIALIQAFTKLGGGCGKACIASAEGEQVFEVAADDILSVVRNGMLDGQDGHALLLSLKLSGEQFLVNLAAQGDSKAQDGIKNLDNVFSNLEQTISLYGKASHPLDLDKAQLDFISVDNRGWYASSVVSGNNLALQILQTYIQNGIKAAQQTDISNIIDPLLQGLSAQLQEAQNTGSSTTSAIMEGISGLLGLAQAASTDTGTKIISGILGTVGISANTANAIATDVSSALGDIAKFVNFLNTDVVQGLINPVLESVEKSETLATALEADLKNGLTGILQIPAQLADYLQSQAAIAQHTVDLTNENRTQVTSQILVPGMESAIGSKIQSLHETIQQLLGTPQVGVAEFTPKTLSEPPAEETFKHDIDAAKDFVNNFTIFGVQPFKAVIAAAMYVLYWGSVVVPLIKLAEQGANISNPVEPLDVESVVELLHRNLITWDQAILEVNKSGIDATRLVSLYTARERLLAPDEVLRAFYRNIITEDAAKAELKYQGYDDSRIQVLEELAKFLPDVGTAANWYARGFISPEQFTDILKENRWSSDEIDIALKALFQPPRLGDYLRFRERMEQAKKGFLAESYSGDVPQDVQEIGQANQLNEDAVKLAWVAHWQDIDVFTWLNAYFRGLIEDDVFTEALASLNYPPEAKKLLVDVNRPLIPFFYLTEMLAAGIFTEPEAEAMLKQYGFDDNAIKAAVKFGKFKSLGKATDQNTALAQLSVSVLKEMYDDQIINKTQLIEGLEEHGYDSEVAILLAELYETQKQIADNKAYADGLLAQVKLGRISKLEALDQLAARGFTQSQLASYEAKIEEAKIQEAKLPSLADFKEFWKKGLITDDDFIAGLELIGYNEKYAQLYLATLKE